MEQLSHLPHWFHWPCHFISNSIFSLTFSAPSSPRGLQVVEKNSTSMKVSWELPTENRECVHHYRICYEPLNLFNLGGRNIPERCIETQNTSIVITDLEPCATYRIKVNAVTALGSYSIDSIEEAFTEFESMYPLHFRVFV